jgi:ATP-dependent RNA helicase DeaD
MNYKNKEVERALAEMGFEELTEIQSKTIPLIEQGMDVIGHSQTGTGKTAAFGLPLLEKIDYNNSNIQSVVICPTRELAVQVRSEINMMGQYLPQLKTVAIYGGEPIHVQIRQLKHKPQLIIGTPGRIIDLLKRKLLKFHDVSYLVLDEADEMLKMGFIEDIETILEKIDSNSQKVMFSATMPKRIINITHQYMKDPQLVSVITNDETNKDITQYYYLVQNKHKVEAVSRLLHVYNPNLTLIFCNTKRKVDDVTRKLEQKGYSVNKIHGDLKQTNRLQVLDSFHAGVLDILVATDVAARGLDIKNVDVVINFDVPEKAEYYVHRIGRTGRIGNKGYSFTLVSRREMSSIDEIVAFTKTNIRKRRIPTPEAVLKIKKDNQISEVLETIETVNLSSYMETASVLLESDETENIVGALLYKLDKNLDDKEINGDINESFISKSHQKSDENQTRYHINVGKDAGLTTKQFVKYLKTKVKISDKDINDVIVTSKGSFFTVSKDHHHKVLSSLTNVKLSGKMVSVRIAKPIKRKSRKH